MSPARVLLLVLLAGAAAAMAWLAVYQVDDAYIVYRYARNCAHGAGLAFNPGERVEGFSCFLWVIALTPLAGAGLALPKVAPLLTALCGLGIIATLARRHADLEQREALAPRDLVPALLLAGTPSFLYWSVGALETVPFTMLVALALRDHGRETRAGASSRRSAIWLGLATLTRPEAPAVVAALGVDRILTARAALPARHAVRDTALWAAIIAAFYVPFVAFRRLYFGDWLPNTYYAKAGGPAALRIEAGWKYLQEAAAGLVPAFGAYSAAIAWAGVLAVVALTVIALLNPRLRAEGMVVAALVAACVFEGGDWMFFGRFLVPALPPLALVAGAALLNLAARGRIARATAAAVIAVILASGAATAAHTRNGGKGLVVQREGYRHAHERVARELARRASRGDAVAMMDVGIVGWLAPELRVIDITGLTDRAIGHAPGRFLDKQFPVADLLARRPRFMVLVPGFAADERIHDDPAFRTAYRLLFAVNHRFNWDPPSEYLLNVVERVAP